MTERPILTITVVFLVLFFGVYFLWLPKYQDVNDFRILVKERKNELEAKRKYFSELEVISNKLKGYQSELSKIESALPSSSQVPDVLNFIEQIALQNGLALEEVGIDKTSPLTTEDGEEMEIKKTSIMTSVIGSYPAFKNFLSALQNSARLIEVDTLSFSFPETGSGETFTFDSMIKVHSY